MSGGEFGIGASCFGGLVHVNVGSADPAPAAMAVLEQLHDADDRLTRFDPASELCRLNRDPREEVPASPLLLDLVEAIHEAGELTLGLVDGTLIDEVEAAGYVRSMRAGADASLDPSAIEGELAPPPPARGRWRTLRVDRSRGLVMRPRGVRVDSGGLGKGLLADRAGASLAGTPTFCVNCCGDMLIGGTAGLLREVRIEHPAGGLPDIEIEVAGGGVATSGVTRRSWTSSAGEARHHLIDPRTGSPAATGVNQVTALAPTALEAERLAKAALLSGPEGAADWLPHGGVVVLADHSVERIEAGSAVLARG